MRGKILTIITAVALIFLLSCDDQENDTSFATGTIIVDSDPQGAEIWLDGANTNMLTPATVEAEEGIREVVLRFEDYPELLISVNVLADQQSVVNQNSFNYQGRLNISSVPSGAIIFLNGIETGTVTPSSFNVADDTYFIFLRLEEYSDTTFVTLITEGSTQDVDIVLQPL